MNRASTTLALTLAAAGLVWIVGRKAPEPLAVSAPTTGDSVRRSAANAGRAVVRPEVSPTDDLIEPFSEPTLAPAAPPLPKAVRVSAREETPDGTEPAPAESTLPPATVLENMRSALRQYHARFRENPVGDNAEITSALTGGNARQAVFAQVEDGLRVNSQGQLIDSWGTPFFFHALSRNEMEIRSAGPDRRMWTTDDLATK